MGFSKSGWGWEIGKRLREDKGRKRFLWRSLGTEIRNKGQQGLPPNCPLAPDRREQIRQRFGVKRSEGKLKLAPLHWEGPQKVPSPLLSRSGKGQVRLIRLWHRGSPAELGVKDSEPKSEGHGQGTQTLKIKKGRKGAGPVV